MAILRFQGGMRVLKTASLIVAKRCESLGETTYYEAKRMVEKLFGFELFLRPDKVQNYTTYQKIFRKRSE